MLSMVASSLWLVPLLLQVRMLWSLLVVTPWVQQYPSAVLFEELKA
jgi:hypothetical protein